MNQHALPLPSGFVTLTVNGWNGPDPRPGDFLKSRHGRRAYCIVATVRTTHTKAWGRLRCYRVALDDIAEGATIHPWQWAKR